MVLRSLGSLRLQGLRCFMHRRCCGRAGANDGVFSYLGGEPCTLTNPPPQETALVGEGWAGLLPRRGSVMWLAPWPPCQTIMEEHQVGWIAAIIIGGIAGFIGACILIAIARAFSGGFQRT